MNFLKLKYFLEVAKYMSFTKAADHNYISQTAVSQHIRSLEKEIGVKLFDRSGGKIKMTSAGESFLQDCSDILVLYERAVAKANKIDENEKKSANIKFGFLTTTNIGYMNNIISTFHEKYPQIKVQLVQGSFVSIRNLLETCKLDVAICPPFELYDAKDITMETVVKQKMGFLVSKNSSLAQRDQIDIKELADVPTITASPEYAGKSYDELMHYRHIDGIHPKIVKLADSGEVLTRLVSMNLGGAYLPSKTAYYNPSTCKLLSIKGSKEELETVIAWCEDALTEPLECFIKILLDFFENHFEDWVIENN